jgi:Tfp pilus assembly protein PilF
LEHTRAKYGLVFALLAAAGLSAAEGPLDGAIEQAQSGNCRGAIQSLRPLFTAPAKPVEPAYLLAADCHRQLGQDADSTKVLRDGLRAHPASGALMRALGQALFRTRFDSAEAGELLRKAAVALQRDPESRHYYAQWAYANSRDRVCVAEEQAALRMPGLNDLALLQMNTLLGLCAGRLDDAGTAKTAFRAANSLNLQQPNYDPVAAWQYVQFLNRAGEEREAQAIVDQTLEHAPRFGPAHLEKAKHHDRAGDTRRAMDQAQLTLVSLGNDINVERAAHGILAKSYAALGRTREAEQEQAWILAHPNPETPRR